MEFRTEIKAEKNYQGLITHHEPVVLIGSCFTDNIGGCMRDELFNVTVNPFGPIYNPVSVHNAVETIVDRKHVSEESLFSHEGRQHSFQFHSRYSSPSKAETLLKMNSSIESAYESLKEASVLILTPGTTHAFRHRDSEIIVANCHKLPATEFEELNLTLNDCTEHLSSAVETVRQLNKQVKIIFTVSPLRYLNYGAHANAVSKATLMLAVEQVISSYTDTYYFPAYEIMNDDLRDYRFYAEDMKHPSSQAVKYIYEIFSSTFYSSDTRELASKCRRITRRLAHRTFNSEQSTAETDETIASFKHTNPELSSIIDSYISDGI